MVRSTVVVHLTDGSSIAGIFLDSYDDVVALARARVLDGPAGQIIGLDGEVLIPHKRVRFVQAGISIDDARGILETVRRETGTG
jgi:hypothetical protein